MKVLDRILAHPTVQRWRRGIGDPTARHGVTAPTVGSHPGDPALEPEGYRVYTHAHDEELTGEAFLTWLKEEYGHRGGDFAEVRRAFVHDFQAERVAILAHAGRLLRKIEAGIPLDERKRTVVSLLLDHSGSMRGLKMLSALTAIECAADMIALAGMSCEILGFTTTSWRGGRSRQQWIADGQPPHPGRLCDLRHIVYREASERHTSGLIAALHPDALYENIDGEALLWAVSRLPPEKWTKRIVCMVGDGAPVDDSTLMANANQSLLWDHFKAVLGDVARDGVPVGYLHLDHQERKLPVVSRHATEPHGAGVALVDLIGQLLLPQATAAPPQGDQAGAQGDDSPPA